MQPGNRRAPKYSEGRAILEYIREPRFDRKRIAAGTTTGQLIFFRNFLASTAWTTNMTSDGSLSTPSTMDIFGISMFVQQGTAAADLHEFYNQAFVEFYIDNKPYLQIPTHMIPAAGGLTGVATANNITELSSGFPSPMNFLPLDLEGNPLHLPSQQAFRVVLNLVGAVAYTADVDVWCYLHGIYGRSSQ